MSRPYSIELDADGQILLSYFYLNEMEVVGQRLAYTYREISNNDCGKEEPWPALKNMPVC